ncbi:MAG: GNAT family N-acetyltransferase, partial [Sphingopyxis sp.]|nr:GNAT family N-acetyltransferase [Sphingopyxis sp.]
MSEYHSNFISARKIAGATLARPQAGARPPAAMVGQAHLFDRIDWFDALHAHCLSDQSAALLHTQSGASALWLMLMADQSSHTVSALANYYSFAWQPIWTGEPTDSAQRHAMMTAAARALKQRFAMLSLAPLPAENPDTAMLADALRSAGWLVDSRAASHNHWLDTNGRNFDEWWAARPGALRSTVQRKAKKGLVALTISDRFSDADWDDYEAVYRASWKPPESHPAFLRAWAEAESAAGTLRLGIARIDGAAVAAQFWSCDTGVAYIHKLAHVAGHDNLSPGTLLTHALFRHAFDIDRVRRIDFGTGDDGYKRDWMEQSAPLIRIEAWNAARPQ